MGDRDIHDLQDFEDMELLAAASRLPKVYKPRKNPSEVYNDIEFSKRYRFSKQAMRRVIALFEDDVSELQDPRGGSFPADLQIMMSIRYWGRNEIQEDGADLHGCSQATVSNVAAKCARVIASKAAQFIHMPLTAHQEADVMEKFQQIRGFPRVVGAIDCTHIRLEPLIKSEIGQMFINRKGYPSINTQVICGPDLKIMDIVAHWRGSTHDARIFRESSIKARFEAGEFHGVLLGDSGYPCTAYLLTPILQPRNIREERYNEAHIPTRTTIERCFGVWKNRFRILKSGIRCSLFTAKATIIATAVLFNLTIDFNDELDDIFDEREADHDDGTNSENDFTERREAELYHRIYAQNHFNI